METLYNYGNLMEPSQRAAALHPFFLLMAAIGIGTGLWTLYQHAPISAPILLAVSLLGLGFRAWQLGPVGRRDATDQINFELLHGKDVLRYEGWLKENVRGHDEVIDELLKNLQRGLGLAGPKRTLGAFMVVGPTGTGKTFLAELTAKALYADSEPLILRMNQYKHPDDVYTLLGPPPGQPGYEVGGALTRPILENPYRVVILDEIDKCHPDIRDCLYDILDAGQCQEKSSGRTVHFNACAIFATCNAAVESLRQIESETKSRASRIGRARDALTASAGFAKAFLARFDEIFFMDELRPIHVAEVACLQLVKYWRQYGIEVTYTAPELLVEAMSRNAEFKEYGVRQLGHFIQTMADSSIEKARLAGARKVRLDVEPSTGEIKIARMDAA